MASSKTTPYPHGAKPLTPEEEMGIDELIAEAERYFGKSAKKSSTSKAKSSDSTSSKSKAKSSDSTSSKSKTKSSDSTSSKSKTKSSDSASSKSKTKSSDSASSKSKAKSSDDSSSKSKAKSPDSASSKSKAKSSDSASSKSKAKSPDSTSSKSKAKSSDGASDKPKTKSADGTSPKPEKTRISVKGRVSVRGLNPKTHRTPEKQENPVAAFFKSLPKWVLYLPLMLMCTLLIWMCCEANMLRLKSAEVTVTDLPYSFRGTRVMYISDLHINSLNSPSKVNALIDEVMQLEPDLLLLGGDYTSSDPIIQLRGIFSSGAARVESDMRNLFFANLAQYTPPLGKYAVAGENDNRLDSFAEVSSLRQAMALGGVTLLKNEIVRIKKDNQTLVIAGIDDWTTGEKDLRSWTEKVSAKECVIVLCHDPESVPLLNSYPASDGFWIDLALCGHTHGGIVSLGSFELLNSTSDRRRFSAGWHQENAAKLLISRGVSNSLIPMRLNAAPEVHMITLK